MLPRELQNEDRAERDRFMAALDRGQTPERAWEAPVELGGFHQATLAARRLKDISDYLLAFAFLLSVLALGLGVLVAWGGGLPGLWASFAFVAGMFLGVLCFLFFKFMSDTVRALADMTDLARSLDARVAQLADLLERDTAESSGEGF